MSRRSDIQDGLDVEALGDEIARMAAHLDAATHRLLTCIRAFDASEEWGRQGALSCAHWLVWRIGLDPGTAREKVRVARALGALPLLDDGLRKGELSYAKVRALTRVANAANEGMLAEMARCCTGAQLERLCRRLRRVTNVNESGERLDEQRFVALSTLDNGMAKLSAVLHPDEAALVMRAIEEVSKASTRREDVSAETRAAMMPMADALVHVARTYLAGGNDGASTSAPPSAKIVVHLERDLLGDGSALAATLDDGTRISAETFRRLGCDCSVVAAPASTQASSQTAEDSPAPVIGRRTRTIGPALRRALWVRDRGCRFPGCSHRLFVHAHHIHHWSHGGATTVENLTLLCSTHHRLVHEGGFTVRRSATDILTFADPRGRLVEAAPRPPSIEGNALHDLETANCKAGLHIHAETGLPDWDGTVPDYEWALDAVIRATT